MKINLIGFVMLYFYILIYKWFKYEYIFNIELWFREMSRKNVVIEFMLVCVFKYKKDDESK